MPRTKAPRKRLETQRKELDEMIENEVLFLQKQTDDLVSQVCARFETLVDAAVNKIPLKIASMTIEELLELPSDWTGNKTTIVQMQTLPRPARVRSSSVCDEGYRTAESDGSSGKRQSRARHRTKQPADQDKTKSKSKLRASSDSRAQTHQRFKTPSRPVPITNYGTITPKIQPNTPQVLLRRPKVGEVAVSLQGSPLVTGNVAVDNMASVNIPLEDGRVFMVQPQAGLRLSQIPLLDNSTARQIQQLRDNLSKFCIANNIK